MPAPLFNESLDDPLLVDAATDFRGGVSRMVAPHLLAPNQFAAATNMMLGVGGNLRTRGGTGPVTLAPNCARLLVAALSGQDDKILLAGATGFRYTTRNAPSPTATLLASAAVSNPTLLQAMDKGYVVSNEDVWEYDGANIYKLRQLTVSVENGGSGYTATPLVTVTPAGGDVPIEEAQIEATLGSGASAGKVVALNVINPGRGYLNVPTVTVAAPSSGTTATATAILRVPPTGSHAVWHTNRLMVADEDTLHVSDFFSPGYFAANNSLRVGGGDGQPITGLKSWDNFNLLVFKGLSTYLVTTDPLAPLAEWRVEKVSGTVGCVAARSAVQVGADVWWLSGQGIVSVRRLAQETQREISSSISLPVGDVVSRINWSHAHTACAAFHDNKVLFALPVNGSTKPNLVLVYDTFAQVWLDGWTGWLVDDMIVASGAAVPELFLLVEGRVVRYDPDLRGDYSPTSENLVPNGQSYPYTGNYTLNGLTPGNQYWWRKGANDLSLTLLVSGETLTKSGAFVADQSGAVRLQGEFGEFDPITAVVFGISNAATPASVDLRAFAFGDFISPKSAFNIELEFTGSSTPAEVFGRSDEGAFLPLLSLPATGRAVLKVPFKLTTPPPVLTAAGNLSVASLLSGLSGFRYVQIRVAATGGLLSLRSLKLTGFADTMRLTG